MNIDLITGCFRGQRGIPHLRGDAVRLFSNRRPGRLSLWLTLLALVSSTGLLANGNWLKCGFSAPDSVGFMLLLSDGTVMALNYPILGSGEAGPDWFKLTPDPNGHYVNGEWSRIASMHDRRQAFGSQVLPDGRVLVIGGEYPKGGPGEASAEIYEPGGDFWVSVNPPSTLMDRTQNSPEYGGTVPNRAQGFIDCNTVLLRDGTVLIAPASPATYNGTLIYNPKANSWTNGPATINYQGETSWLKLPDGSILTVDVGTNLTERYIPSLNQWIQDADVPVNLWGTLPHPVLPEIGPALLLPNGKGFFLGGSGKTAIYVPSGGTNRGSWLPGPDIPDGRVSADAPAAMLPNGKILCAVSGPPLSSLNSEGEAQFTTPTSFYEYDYSEGLVGAFHQVDGPTGTTDDIRSQDARLLVLPDGSVLYCHTPSSDSFFSPAGAQLYVYVPSDGVPVATKPVIRSITPNSDGTFLLEGTGLSGISAGAAFGDDAQMDSNYPIIMFKDPPTGHVDYGRTFNWSETSVMTGYETETVKFTLPQGLVATIYELSVSVNGIISDPVQFSFVTPSFVAICPGEGATLKLLTTPDPKVYYYWEFNLQPIPGATNVEYSIVSAQTNQSGYYNLMYISGNEYIGSLMVPVAVGVWIIDQPSATNSTAICQPYSMSVHARGKGTLTADWFRGGEKMTADSRISFTSQPGNPGETVFSINFSQVEYEDDAIYTVVITDDCGHRSTDPFPLRVTPNPSWVRIATDGPPTRANASMCYDSDRHVTVLFGGRAGLATPGGGYTTYLGDTWEFDGKNWTQRLPLASPVPRYQANMVYDTFRHRTVLFGGLHHDATYGPRFSPETWEWDGTNWQQIATAHVPPLGESLYDSTACYDGARKEMLLFASLAEPLWAYNGTDWSVRNSGGAGPGYYIGCLMTFDISRHVAVLLGAAGGVLAQFPGRALWEWDGFLWHERLQSGQRPWLNYTGNAVTYDTFRQECVVFGEEIGDVDGQETQFLSPAPDFLRYIWRWNGAQWQADPPTPTAGVSANQYHSMAFDSDRNALVLFGGSNEKGDYNTNYTYEIVYKDAPTVLKQPAFQFATLGQDTQITVVVGGAPVIGYQWQKNGVLLTDGGRISGSTSNILQITAVSPGDFGEYQLAMSNLCGTATSQPIQMRVGLAPIAVALSSGGIVMAWPDPAAILQTASSPVGPWTAVPAPTNPYTVIPRASEGFFRLMH